MKKFIFAISLILGAVSVANAQGMYDALNFSDSNYYGTARSMSLGNAVTALGGDLGSITLNPAGSAVAGYSQVVITPGISIATTSTSYTPVAGEPYVTSGKDNFTRFTMPNIGATMHFDLGNYTGLKSITVGIVSNRSNNFLGRASAVGTNHMTSITGALSSGATALDVAPEVLEKYDSFYDKGASYWPYLVGKQSDLITNIGDTRYYAGAAENIKYDPETDIYHIYLGGPLTQLYRRQERGYKNDTAFNIGFNFSDIVFLGVNMGIPVLQYEAIDYLQESAQNSGDFDTGLTSLSYKYHYRAQADGIYARIGVIALPLPGLRLGASFQTPTAYVVRDTYYLSGSTAYSHGSFGGRSQSSPDDDFSYRFRSPSILDLGIAYTLGNIGLISFDWERTFYNQMRFSERDSNFGSDYFYYSNKDIQDYCMPGDMFRAGLEVNVLPELALRVGYNFKNSPEAESPVNRKRLPDNTQSFSAGIGYSSPGSFFVDLAAKGTFFPTKYYHPYADYLYDTDGNIVPSMEMSSTRKLVDVLLTVGWRF